MLNGMIKLFYTEIVKNKIKALPNESYELSKRAKKIQAISKKLDTVIFTLLKIIIYILIFCISYRLNIYLGIIVLSLEVLGVLYFEKLKTKVEHNIESVKLNIKANSDSSFLNNAVKRNLSVLLSIFLLGLVARFNFIIILSLILVIIATALQILNIKKEN